MRIRNAVLLAVLILAGVGGFVLAQTRQATEHRLLWHEWENRNHPYATKHVMKIVGDGTDRATVLVSNFETDKVDEYRAITRAAVTWGGDSLELSWNQEKAGWYGELPSGWTHDFPTVTIRAWDTQGRVAYESMLYEMGRL